MVDSSADSGSRVKVSAPFRNGIRNQGSADIDDRPGGSRFNNDYYASGKQNDNSNDGSNNSARDMDNGKFAKG